MSLENHPNFHAVKFAGDISVSFVECRRGRALGKNMPKGIDSLIVEFVAAVEDLVDASVEEDKAAAAYHAMTGE